MSKSGSRVFAYGGTWPRSPSPTVRLPLPSGEGWGEGDLRPRRYSGGFLAFARDDKAGWGEETHKAPLQAKTPAHPLHRAAQALVGLCAAQPGRTACGPTMGLHTFAAK